MKERRRGKHPPTCWFLPKTPRAGARSGSPQESIIPSGVPIQGRLPWTWIIIKCLPVTLAEVSLGRKPAPLCHNICPVKSCLLFDSVVSPWVFTKHQIIRCFHLHVCFEGEDVIAADFNRDSIWPWSYPFTTAALMLKVDVLPVYLWTQHTFF